MLHYVEGDVARLRCQLEGQNLSGMSFLARLRRNDNTLIERAGQIENAGSDWFFFEWEPSDLVKGTHELDVVITDAAGNARSYPSDQFVTVHVRGRA